MKIFSHSDPNYFGFCEALVKSIRYHENEHDLTLLLMDFSDQQKEEVQEKFKNDSKLDFWFVNGEDLGYSINDKVQFYRNCRTRFFLKMLEKYDENLLTLCANGLVWTKLDYIEEDLKENDFVFLERSKKMVYNVPWPSEWVRNIEELSKLVKTHNLDLDDVLEKTTGKVVLLGTHGIQNNEMAKKVISRWREHVENAENLNKWYSDMNLFVKSFIEITDETGYNFKKKTGWDIPREENPYVDTKFTTKKIWFAKGPRKFTHPTYIEKVNFFKKYEYSL